VQAPFGGLAWVSVETDDVLDTFVAQMPGNAGRVEVPIKKEYAPNATVTVHLLKPGGDGELPMERFGFTRIDVKRPDLALDVAPVVEKESVEPRQRVSGGATVTCEGKPVAGAEVTVFAVDERVLKLGEWKMADLLPIFYPRNPFAVVTYEALGQFVEAITVNSEFQKGFIIGGGGKSMQGVSADEMLARKKFRILAFWQSEMTTGADGRVAFDFEAPDNLSTFRVTAVAHTKESQFGSGGTSVMVTKKLICDAALPRFLRVGDEVELRAVGRQRFADEEALTAKCVTDAGLELLDAEPQSQNAKRDVPAVFKFRAKVRDAATTMVRFDLAAKSGAQDIVENTLPIHPPTVLRRESVGGVVEKGVVNLAAKVPPAWKDATGRADVTLSTSPWLPKLLGLPQVLDYPHGCFEQIGSRVLSYALLGDLLAYLPDAAAREKHYAAALEDGLRKMQQAQRYDGFLPYWSGGAEAHPFVTVLALWAAREAANAGFDVDGALIEKLATATKSVVSGKTPTDPFTRAFALMVGSDEPDDGDAAIAQDLYLRRNDLGDEGRALLAFAMKRRNIMAKETDQLLREIAKPAAERAFDPRNFSSTTRAEAMRALAFATVTPKKIPADITKRLNAMMDSSEALSTQENLWLLLAFDAMHREQKFPKLAGGERMGFVLSKNSASAEALGIPFGEAAVLSKRLALDLFLKNNPASSFKNAAAWLMRAEFRVNDAAPPRDDRGLHVERVVRNLTEPARTGDAAAPFKLGDRILVTYRLHTRKLHNYVALEDLLPAGLETINPNLPSIGKFYELPREAEGATLALSHSELRDQSTCLYFDRVDPGAGVYSVLARATSAGTFRWPQTQAVPMYDSCFGGLSAASLCVVQE
jgi:uncharacterized protein YfaS (alpha-2-macroglobulin family)